MIWYVAYRISINTGTEPLYANAHSIDYWLTRHNCQSSCPRSTMERQASTVSNASGSTTSSLGSNGESSKNEHSLYSNLVQCQVALRRLQASSKLMHPMVQSLVHTLDESIGFCLPVCSGDAKKLYSYIFDILDKLNAAYSNRLALYFNRSPYWQHYQTNMIEILSMLAACCSSRTSNGHASVEFRRKFIPMADVMRRRPSSLAGPVSWRKRSIPGNV